MAERRASHRAGVAKIRVLLADDHGVLRAGLRLLVNAEPDMEVTGEAGSAEETVRVAKEARPDVTVLDLSMPGGGLKALEALRRQCPDTRVLVLTMHDDPAYLRSALAAGAVGYVVKKVADRELLSSIRAVYHGATIAFLSAPAGGSHAARVSEALPDAAARPTLSNREQEVLVLLARGYTNRQIAERLQRSVKSIETHRSRLSQKLGLKTRAEIVRYAFTTGLLDSASASQEEAARPD